MVDIVRRLAGAWSDSFGRMRAARDRPLPHLPQSRPSLLVVGAYLAERKNLIGHLVHTLASSRHCEVTQRWAAIGHAPPDAAVAAVTVEEVLSPIPKLTLINRLVGLADLERYDYIMVCDDDITLPRDFIDRFIGWQQHCGFALAQPARTWNSYVDHRFVRRRLHCKARETRFVEIGPVICFDRAMGRLLLPFDQASAMGWGYDLVWPVIAQKHGLRLGIVDDAAVEHRIRARGAFYPAGPELQSTQEFLATREHLCARDAFVVRKTYR